MINMIHQGFTLIELLVVITIIVVLLALLTPALDKAIYQAELAVCATNERGVATGASAYAMAFNRRYPYRAVLESSFSSGGLSYLPYAISYGPGYNDDPKRDLRLIIDGYMSMDMFVDPLHEDVDLGLGANGPRTQIYTAYNLWFSWQYKEPGNEQPGMWKMGDRWGYATTDADGVQTRYRWSYLVGDMSVILPDSPGTWNAHPDTDGVMTTLHEQNEQFGVNPRVSRTWACWISGASARRGEVDMNYASADGSVERFNAMRYDDERLVLTAHFHDSSTGAAAGAAFGEGWNQVPK